VVPPLRPAQSTADTPSGPLSGVRVVELGGIGPAQLGGLLLSDLGADVVLVDRRGTGPAALAVGDPRAEVLNRGRRSIALDLKTPEGLATAWRLIETADVLVDPYRPGVAERLGLGPDEALERNPGLVYARMTGWGQDGPLAQAAGHDINYIALAGALEPMGEEGRPPPVPLNLIGDFGGGGMLMAFGIVSALLERERSGRGQVLDIAMVDGVAALLNGIFHLRAIGGWREGRGRNWVQGAAPWYRAYATADGGHVTVGALEPKFYALLLERLGLDADAWPQWDEGDWDALAIRLESIFASEDLAHWREVLEGTDACFAPAVPLAEVAEHPHHVARGTYVELDGVLQAAPVPRFSRTPGAIRRPPPLPGEHAEELLAELDAAERRAP
jgi:alpha-methylacyl-CoA racemase